ncbi:Angiotensin-converting enzyme precursor, putative [Pediculus humanus corporis]|uniref:Angiotensin-converting enzyme n=1 Tax=Pediculus humanus subsp. corporis TaxID=121224 RepID=E0VYZ8_PEDHC|nr:Angiotensin-converting enzyme precursor, putative [Pediculus humanus corporis]EEB18604.1 Angiotensin-converting enzyme precursor, putative [Pediculus humanus corporis]
MSLNKFVCGVKYDEEDGKIYLKKINEEVQVKTTESVVASWRYESNITDENLQNQLDVSAKLANYTKEVWKETIKYPWKTFKDEDVKRQFKKFSVLGTAILSSDKYEKYDKIVSEMQSVYGKAKVCNYHNRTDCSLQLEPELTEIFTESRDPNELKYYWEQWRNAAGKPVRDLYKQYVALSNEAAVLNNFTDTSEFWLKDYEADDFKDQVEVLWEQVKPLYLQLHAYVRRRLREQYGEEHVSKRGPIPAHLLGNMWAQSWGNVYNYSLPYPGKASMDVTENMVKQGYTPLRMFKLAEEFFTSLNLSPMPETFWKNSILEKPGDGRDLICHASAWDFYDGKDFRIKQCTRVNMEDLNTVHHEMGHIQYFLQYKNQPLVYKEGTNPGFHEAIGDVMALSVSTPKHLKKIGLLDCTDDDYESDINQLYNMALDKVAFLPFGFLMDQWRWSVFEGKTTESKYNCKWWQLREKYQGLAPSVLRSEKDFDPGAKYHTIANVPYIRYFVSFIIQFQFHRSLCIAAKEYDPENPTLKPLHRCDIYQSQEAGKLLKKMLQMGSSKPWPDAMEVLTGQRKMDASALLDYFSSLKNWLEKENKRTGEFIGWETEDDDEDCKSFTSRDVASGTLNKQGKTGYEDNVPYSYAEFVHQYDNVYDNNPEYTNEIKPSFYSSVIFKTKNDVVPEKFLILDDNQLKKSNDLTNAIASENGLKKKESTETTINVLPLSDFLIIQDKKKFQEEIEKRKKVLNLPFEVRSKYDDMEKTKILNVIIHDLHNVKKNKQQQLNKNPIVELSEINLLNDKIIPSIRVLNDNDKSDKTNIKNNKVKKSINNLSKMKRIIGENEGDNLAGISCGSLFKTLKLKDSSPQKICKTQNVVENNNNNNKEKCKNEKPLGELMWKAEVVKSGAEKMLKNFNLSELGFQCSKITNPEWKEKCLEMNRIMASDNSKSGEQTFKPSPQQTQNKIKRKGSRSVLLLKTVTEPSKRDTCDKKKKMSLNDDINILFNALFIDNFSIEPKQIVKKQQQEKPLEKNKNDFIILIGRLNGGNANGNGNSNSNSNRNSYNNIKKNKKHVKKSYKEYHYIPGNSVVYNSVVLTPPAKNSKPENNKKVLFNLNNDGDGDDDDDYDVQVLYKNLAVSSFT